MKAQMYNEFSKRARVGSDKVLLLRINNKLNTLYYVYFNACHFCSGYPCDCIGG